MNRYTLAAVIGLQWLALAGGAVVLAVNRRRAPRAVGFALPVVVLMTLLMSIEPVYLLTQAQVRLPIWLRETVTWGQGFTAVAVVVMMPVAAMMDRRRGPVGD